MTQQSPEPTLIPAPIPANEAERLAALHRYKILDTPPEAAFDRITALAARLFNMPIVLVSLVDESRAWFKSCCGFDLPEVPRDATLCSFALLSDDVLVVPDTRLDQRFACNPFVQREPGVRFYAGAPLLTRDGFNLGTLCLLDGQPREALSPDQQTILTDLAAIIVDELELRLATRRIVQQDAALRENEERLKTLVKNMPGMVYRFAPCTDGSDAFTYVSAGSHDLFELEPETVLQDAESLWTLIHPDDLPSLQASVAAAVACSGVWQWEGRLITPSGQLKWIQGISRPQQTELGEVWDGLMIDITDHKQAEAALSESEERFRNMADNAPMMVWVTDPTGYCTYLSQSWYDFSGQTEETGLGFGWLDAIHPEDHAAAKTRFLSANARQEAFQLEYRLQRQDGKYRACIDAASPCFGSNGEFKGFIGSVIDINDRKRIEAEREQILKREQTAREAAERANRIKDEFLAVLSHELRSPLNPILGWSNLLRNGKLDTTRTAHALETIERNARLQGQLIDDLLDISRILRGKLALTVAPIDLSLVITAALETVRLAAEAKSLSIETVISPSVGFVSGDAGRLQQVVWNLLSNAVKFTPPGGQIAVELSQIETDVQIQVKDTGKGIKPEFLPFVFEHFRQEDGATTRKFGGLGLGLAITRQIVEMHGGTVSVESLGEGQGATFTVRLPLASQSVKMPASEQPSESTLDLSGVHILVVDDDTDSREFVAFVLEQAHAIVTSISSGIDALELITQSIPDLVVSDIGMPDMDGYMLMQQIRALPAAQAKKMPAIALTAYAGEINQQQALAAGFHHHLAKPVEPEALVKAIVTLLTSSRY